MSNIGDGDPFSLRPKDMVSSLAIKFKAKDAKERTGFKFKIITFEWHQTVPVKNPVECSAKFYFIRIQPLCHVN